MIDESVYRKLRRGPAVITLKDAGIICAFTGIGCGDKVIEVGGGSGFLTVFLANIVGEGGKVFSYERRPEFAEIIRKNLVKTNLESRVQVIEKDAFEGVEQKDVDLFVLDLADAEKLLPNAFGALKQGGYATGFLPNVEQVKEFVFTGEELGFIHKQTVEVGVRELLVRKDRGVRPQTKGLMHTAYLSFLQKEVKK